MDTKTSVDEFVRGCDEMIEGGGKFAVHFCVGLIRDARHAADILGITPDEADNLKDRMCGLLRSYDICRHDVAADPVHGIPLPDLFDALLEKREEARRMTKSMDENSGKEAFQAIKRAHENEEGIFWDYTQVRLELDMLSEAIKRVADAEACSAIERYDKKSAQYMASSGETFTPHESFDPILALLDVIRELRNKVKPAVSDDDVPRPFIMGRGGKPGEA